MMAVLHYQGGGWILFTIFKEFECIFNVASSILNQIHPWAALYNIKEIQITIKICPLFALHIGEIIFENVSKCRKINLQKTLIMQIAQRIIYE